MAAVPSPEDSGVVALQKMFPKRELVDLDPAAKWLEDNFGVATYDDLEGAGVWAKMGMSLVVADDALSMGSKGVLQSLLLQKMQEAEKEDAARSAAKGVGKGNGYSDGQEPPKAEVESVGASDEAGLPEQQSLRGYLKHKFPEQSLEVLEWGTAWLKVKFGMDMAEDLEGFGAMADTALQVLAEDLEINVDAQEMLEELFAMLKEAEDAANIKREEAAAVQVPLPEDSVMVSLQKMHPSHALELLELSAAWLEKQFGVATYEDLEDAGAWAKMAMELVATDSDLDSATKDFMKDVLLPRLAVQDESSSAACGSSAVAGPQPDDSMIAALEKMFPDKALGVMAPVSSWLGEKFGVETYADFEGAGTWAGLALELVAAEDSLGHDSKTFLADLLKQLAGPPAAVSTSSSSGKRSKADFIIAKVLGEGSYAQVYMVTETSSNKSFAMKEININKMAVSEVQIEVDIHMSLDHPNISHCFEVFEEVGNMYVLLELAGGDLYHHMIQEKHLIESEAARLFSEASSGLHYLHLKGWMHRDIKPENILLDKELHAKLADFGCCTEVAAGKTKACGTPAYFAPEMCAGFEYDHRIDVWAMGILLYEMIVGHSPFSSAITERETKKRVLAMDFGYGAWFNVPAGSQVLIKQILTKDPNDRLTMLDALRNEWVVSLIGDSIYVVARELDSSMQGRAAS